MALKSMSVAKLKDAGISRAEVSQSERPVADLGRSRSAAVLGA
jgi:uncharacterized protein YjiS (DUF1127 family)